MATESITEHYRFFFDLILVDEAPFDAVPFFFEHMFDDKIAGIVDYFSPSFHDVLHFVVEFYASLHLKNGKSVVSFIYGHINKDYVRILIVNKYNFKFLIQIY